eukprot:1869984-Pyramimonas_sp.AAC.1
MHRRHRLQHEARPHHHQRVMTTPMTMVRGDSLWITRPRYLAVGSPGAIRTQMTSICWIVSLISRWHSHGRECLGQDSFSPAPRRT